MAAALAERVAVVFVRRMIPGRSLPAFDERRPLNRVFVNSTPDTGSTVGKTNSQNLTPIGDDNRRRIYRIRHSRMVDDSEVIQKTRFEQTRSCKIWSLGLANLGGIRLG
jgi:hypothetical protein